MHHIAPDTLHKTKTRLNPKRSQKADERHALTRTRDWGWQRAALSSLQSASQAPRLHLSPSPGTRPTSARSRPGITAYYRNIIL